MATTTGVKPMPEYVPPKDGVPRNAVDEKWMKLRRSGIRLMQRKAAGKNGTERRS